MTLGLLFWVIAIISVLFGFWSSRTPAYASYTWGAPFVLILILGWQVFGPALHR
jgi:hypothetical protein